MWLIFWSFLTDDLPRLDHAAAGGDHGVSDLLPSLAVLHRAGDEGEKTKTERFTNHALPSHFPASSAFPGNKLHKCAVAKCRVMSEDEQQYQVENLMIRADLRAETRRPRFTVNGRLNAAGPGFNGTAAWWESNTGL